MNVMNFVPKMMKEYFKKKRGGGGWGGWGLIYTKKSQEKMWK